MRGIIFLAGSIVGGLALAFIAVVARPDLIRRGSTSAPVTVVAGPRPTEPAPARVTYSAAVQRAAPSVVNVYTARLVTERVAPSSLGELFGGFLPRYRQRVDGTHRGLRHVLEPTADCRRAGCRPACDWQRCRGPRPCAAIWPSENDAVIDGKVGFYSTIKQ